MTDSGFEEEYQARMYKTLSVIMPVFNERNTVAEIVRRMRAVDIPLVLQVIVVGRRGRATGRTRCSRRWRIPPSASSRMRRIRARERPFAPGLAAATGDLILIQDADLEYDPDDWPRLLDPVLKGKAAGRLRQPFHR